MLWYNCKGGVVDPYIEPSYIASGAENIPTWSLQYSDTRCNCKGGVADTYIEPSHIARGSEILLVILAKQRYDGETVRGCG